MNIEIDSKSGFCFGVVYAIQIVEDFLEQNKTLYCLGDIVHNNVEVERLKKKGLITIDHEKFNQLKDCTVLIRAHGEPPETYKIALKNNITLIDASCPVVLQLQKKIKKGFDKTIHDKKQIVIYGKKGHAEVNGLVGQTKEKAIVISSEEDLDKINYKKSVILYSQTTKSPDGYKVIQKEIEMRLKAADNEDNNQLISNNTICRQVSGRDSELRNFARKHDVIIFVSGKKSSNGQMLYEVCKEANINTHFVSDIHDLDSTWFQANSSIGICGATSSPRWLMEKIAAKIEEMD